MNPTILYGVVLYNILSISCDESGMCVHVSVECLLNSTVGFISIATNVPLGRDFLLVLYIYCIEMIMCTMSCFT